MGAPKGNEYYKLRLSDGRDRIFEEPEEMAKKANEYFQWVLDNPLIEEVIIPKQWTDEDKVVHPYMTTEQKKMRAFTYQGLCNFIGMHTSSFDEYEKRKGFSSIYNNVRQIIDNQQFEGAASGFLNASLIARRQGIVDRTENVNTNINADVKGRTRQEVIDSILKKEK